MGGHDSTFSGRGGRLGRCFRVRLRRLLSRGGLFAGRLRQELEAIGFDLHTAPLLTVLGFPGSAAQAPFDVNGAAFFQTFAAAFRCLAPYGDGHERSIVPPLAGSASTKRRGDPVFAPTYSIFPARDASAYAWTGVPSITVSGWRTTGVDSKSCLILSILKAVPA